MRRIIILLIGVLFLASCSQKSVELPTENYAVPVLGYHDIRDKEQDKYSVSVETFYNDMKWLKDNGYKTIDWNTLSSGKIPKKSVIITFDDGYKSYRMFAYPILKQFGFKSTVNIIGEFVGKDMQDVGETRTMMDWETLKELAKDPDVEIGCHTYNLHHFATKGVHDVPAETLKLDLITFKKVMKDQLKIDSKVLAWPYGMYTNESIKIAKEQGFQFITASWSGIVTQDTDLLDIPRMHITKTEPLSYFLGK